MEDLRITLIERLLADSALFFTETTVRSNADAVVRGSENDERARALGGGGGINAYTWLAEVESLLLSLCGLAQHEATLREATLREQQRPIARRRRKLENKLEHEVKRS